MQKMTSYIIKEDVCIKSHVFTVIFINFISAGLSDVMRKDFAVMRDLAQHTRINPENRVQMLRTFLNDASRHVKFI